MRKLIEKQQNSLVACDNQSCDYSVPYTDETEKYLVLFINKPCPKCGENLLTMEDYLQYQNLMKVVNFVNRWFSWITVFYSKKSLENRNSVRVHVHDGVKVSKHER
jgi:ribosomal protein S27AE